MGTPEAACGSLLQDVADKKERRTGQKKERKEKNTIIPEFLHICLYFDHYALHRDFRK